MEIKNIITTFLFILLIMFVFNLFLSFTNKISSFNYWLDDLFNKPVVDIDSTLGLKRNTNGGLTPDEIKEQVAMSNCPTHEDMFNNLYIQDYGDIICFYKQIVTLDNKTIYPNIVFVKTDNGLIYNGALNMSAKLHFTYMGFKSTFSSKQNFNQKPFYVAKSTLFTSNFNLCLIDSGDIRFCSITGFTSPFLNNVSKIMNGTQKYLMDNIVNKYFLDYCNGQVEIIQGENYKQDFNTYYNYVYECAKSHDYGIDSKGNKIEYGNCLVDVTSLACMPLPLDKTTEFAIDSTANPIEYFKVYKTNIFMNCFYEKGNKIYNETKKLKKGIKSEPVPNTEIPIASLNNVTINLLPVGSYDKSIVANVVQNFPVRIEIKKDDVIYRNILFDKSNYLNENFTHSVGLVDGTYTYRIISNQLIFNDAMGSFVITTSSVINFDYEYTSGQVQANFKMQTLLDLSQEDLSLHPIKLVLNSVNSSNSYEILFNSNSNINVFKSKIINIGNYNYVILSDYYIFSALNGIINVTTSSREFVFNFTNTTSNEPEHSVSINVSKNALSSVVNGEYKVTLNLHDEDCLNLINEEFATGHLETYSFQLLFYDNIECFEDDGYLDLTGFSTSRPFYIDLSTLVSSDDMSYYFTNLDFVSGTYYVVISFVNSRTHHMLFSTDYFTVEFEEGYEIIIDFDIN